MGSDEAGAEVAGGLIALASAKRNVRVIAKDSG